MISFAKKLGSSMEPKGNTPGPGNYDPVNVRSSISGGRIGEKIKVVQKIYNHTGPGSYEILSDIDKSMIRSKTSRGSMGGGRYKLSEKLHVPGPGMYNMDSFTTKSTGYGFGSSKRSELTNKRLKTPGPG